MMTAMPIRWRLTLFHVLTVLGIGVLLVIGLFAVFGIAVSEAVEQQASSRANEAARIIESAGGLSDDDLASLSRDNVIVIALDERGAIVAQTGAGIPAGTTVPKDLWREVLASGGGKGGEHRGPLTPWDDSIRYLHAEPVDAPGSPIRVVQAIISYDYVGQTQFEIVTLLFAAIGILVIVLISIGSFLSFASRWRRSPRSQLPPPKLRRSICRGACRCGRNAMSWGGSRSRSMSCSNDLRTRSGTAKRHLRINAGSSPTPATNCAHR